MDFIRALKNNDDSILDYFNPINCKSVKQDANFKNMIELLEEKFHTLLSDEDIEKAEFLVPDLPKSKKDVKRKRSRATKKKPSTATRNSSLQKIDRPFDSHNSSSDSVASCDTLRKSSRIASKMGEILKQEVRVTIPSIPKDTENSATQIRVRKNIQEPTSPTLPPTKIRCIENAGLRELNISKRSLEDMKEPLGSSTPTNMRLETCKKGDLQESSLNSTLKQIDTIKKPKMKPNIFTEQSLSAIKGDRRTRNQDKFLQEKNTNVKTIEEKCQEAQKKKEVIIKSSAEETKRKREERTRKAAALREVILQQKVKQAQKQQEKEMKLKQIEKEKDEKLRIETLKKKQLAVMKQLEIEKRKKEEETVKLLKIQKGELKSEPMEYAIDNVLDGASSDEEDRPKNTVPAWAMKENRKYPLLIQAWLDKDNVIRPWFFNKKLKYPKLEVLFSGVNLKMRSRASSALWNSVLVDFDEAFPIHN